MGTHQENVRLALELAQKAMKCAEEQNAGLDRKIPEVTRIDDLQYGPDSKWNLLDVYLPEEHAKKVPVIFYFHGGSWISGIKENAQFYGMSFAKHGFAFVNISYRLPPDVVFPGSLDDVDQAIHWTCDHAKKYDLDLKNAFLIGDSAGGQMVSQYLTILTNDVFREKFGYSKPQMTVKAAALNCAPAFLDTPGMLYDSSKAYFTEDILKNHLDMLQTESYITPAWPPIFLMTSNEDFIRDCSLAFAGYLKARNVLYEFHDYGTKEAPQKHCFHCDVRNPVGERCNLDELSFFRKYLD